MDLVLLSELEAEGVGVVVEAEDAGLRGRQPGQRHLVSSFIVTETGSCYSAIVYLHL